MNSCQERVNQILEDSQRVPGTGSVRRHFLHVSFLKPPFGEMKEANSTSILGWLLCAAVLGPFLAGLAAIGCLEVQWKWGVPVKRDNLT